MTATKLSLIALLLSFSMTSARAQSQADQDACTPDVFRLCGDYIPNEAPIVSCLKAAGPRLSPACHEVMFRGEPEATTEVVETSAKKPRKHRARKHHHKVQPQM